MGGFPWVGGRRRCLHAPPTVPSTVVKRSRICLTPAHPQDVAKGCPSAEGTKLDQYLAPDPAQPYLDRLYPLHSCRSRCLARCGILTGVLARGWEGMVGEGSTGTASTCAEVFMLCPCKPCAPLSPSPRRFINYLVHTRPSTHAGLLPALLAPRSLLQALTLHVHVLALSAWLLLATCTHMAWYRQHRQQVVQCVFLARAAAAVARLGVHLMALRTEVQDLPILAAFTWLLTLMVMVRTAMHMNQVGPCSTTEAMQPCSGMHSACKGLLH